MWLAGAAASRLILWRKAYIQLPQLFVRNVCVYIFCIYLLKHVTTYETFAAKRTRENSSIFNNHLYCGQAKLFVTQHPDASPSLCMCMLFMAFCEKQTAAMKNVAAVLPLRKRRTAARAGSGPDTCRTPSVTRQRLLYPRTRAQHMLYIPACIYARCYVYVLQRLPTFMELHDGISFYFWEIFAAGTCGRMS